MNGIILLILYILIFIFQIIFLIKATKKNNTKYWKIIFIIEATSLVTATILTIIYNYLPGNGVMPGLTYVAHWFFSFGANIIYALMLFITICIKIIKFEMNLKKQGKYYAQPFYLILATLFIIGGIIFLGYEILNNWEIKKTTGTVIGFEEEPYTVYNPATGIREEHISLYPVVQYIVNGNTYTDDAYYIDNTSIGETVTIYYAPHVTDGYNITRITNTKIFYLPLFALASLIIFIRFRKR